jgi:hypothetical protein
MDLSNGFMIDSACELPCGHNGDSMPLISMYRLISCPLNGVPLSDTTLYGIPCVENTLSSFGISAAADIGCTISTSGYQEYASIATSISSPVGSGPRKSIRHNYGISVFNGLI